MNNFENLSILVSLVSPFYESLDPWHGIVHGKRVVKIAKLINETEKGDPSLVEAGGWIHQYHDNTEELRIVLEHAGFDEKEKEKLIEVAEFCRSLKISSQNLLEARIVFDADALELMGPYGLIREVLCNAVHRGKEQDAAVCDARKVYQIFKDNLQTETAKKMAEELNESVEEFWKVFDFWEEKIIS